ncbi:MAG: 30S ribosomal protein S3 [Clostridia bacterium]|nr:30S ribosomal protein S3 [Clostridia bacterium]
MGQKVNPHGFRVGVIKDWDSRWFTKDEKFGDTLVSDYNLRKFLKTKLQEAGVPRIEIERDNERVRVFIHCAKPGIIIGRNGAEIEKLKATLEAMVGKTVVINVVEVKDPDMNAQLVAENIALQLERRASFRRCMKQAIGRTMRLGAKGIKIQLGGRLAGAEIARTEHYHEGTIPLQTIRADIDYGVWEANTTYGKIGVKVWIYKGEILADSNTKTKRNYDQKRDRNDRRRNDRRDRTDRKDFGDRKGQGRSFGGGKNGKGRPGMDREVKNYSNRNANFKKPAPKAAPVEEAPAATPEEGGNN